jgi:ABC-type multidrug transport system fused ATPase/permease subunit
MKTVWRVFAYLKRYPWMAAATLTCAILSTLTVIVFPGVTKWIIDGVVRANRPDRLLPLYCTDGGRVCASARIQRAADHPKQHVRAKSHF